MLDQLRGCVEVEALFLQVGHLPQESARRRERATDARVASRLADLVIEKDRDSHFARLESQVRFFEDADIGIRSR